MLLKPKCIFIVLLLVKNHWIRYYDTVYERDGINYFWSIKNSSGVLNKFKSKNFKASKLSTYDTHYLACNEDCFFLFSLLMYTIITIYGFVKKSVMPLFNFWIIFLLDLELNLIGKLLVFRWKLIVLLLLQMFLFVMREIS